MKIISVIRSDNVRLVIIAKSRKNAKKNRAAKEKLLHKIIIGKFQEKQRKCTKSARKIYERLYFRFRTKKTLARKTKANQIEIR